MFLIRDREWGLTDVDALAFEYTECLMVGLDRDRLEWDIAIGPRLVGGIGDCYFPIRHIQKS